MSAGPAREAIASAFIAACLGELAALKPGNVHQFADGHGMQAADFEKSARVSAPFIAAPLSVGARIRKSAEATAQAVGSNTNLGILLLAAPLAAAAERPGTAPLRNKLAEVLGGLDVADAREAYAGIRAAHAGGLGQVEAQDIAHEPSVSLLEAMRAAEERDRIAWNYTHDFADIFVRGLGWLAEAEGQGADAAWSTSFVYLHLLAVCPDSLVARKYGTETAEALAEEARPHAAALDAALARRSDLSALVPDLLAFDRSLKSRGLNPGTTADLTVATLFAASLQRPKSLGL